jgi:Tol biopolymer transport system component
MVWVDEAGDETPAWREPLTGLWSAVRVSPDGRRAILVSRDGNDEERAELLDLEGGSRARIGPKGLLVAAPLWFRDGERIVVEAEVDGQRQLAWLRPLPDEPLHPLTSGPGMRHRPGGFTPDGRSVLFAQFSKLDGIGDLLVTDLDGGTPPRPFLAGPANERSPRLSPDGRWVAYLSDAGGEMELWITDFPAAGARLQIPTLSKDFEFQVGWLSADEIWWRDSERRHLVAAKIRQRGAAIEIAGRRELLGGRTLAPENETFAEGVFDYSPARRSFLLGRDVELLLPPDLILVSDWRAALGDGEAKQ